MTSARGQIVSGMGNHKNVRLLWVQSANGNGCQATCLVARNISCGTTVVRCAVYHGCHHLYIHTQSIRNQNCRLEFGRVEYCTIPQKRTGLEPSPSVKCLDRKCACLVLQLLLMSLTEEGQLVLVVLGLVGIRLPFFPNIPCNITLTGRIVDKRRHSK